MTALDLQPLRATFRGEIFTPSDSGYDAARQIWNASINKRPAVIARCTGIADIIAAVNFGRDQNLLTAIRGGGHNVGGRPKRPLDKHGSWHVRTTGRAVSPLCVARRGCDCEWA